MVSRTFEHERTYFQFWPAVDLVDVDKATKDMRVKVHCDPDKSSIFCGLESSYSSTRIATSF